MTQTEDIKILIEPVLDGLGIDLVDLEVKGGGGRCIIRVYVDEEGGISIDRCTRASRAIADIFDQKDPIAGRYTLEVSSPGIDRPLKTSKDFVRHRNRKVDVHYATGGESFQCLGHIDHVESDFLYLRIPQGEEKIALSDITLAKIVVEMK